MAVHCGVCAVQLDGGWENGGSFSTTPFDGWSEGSRGGREPRISDTCNSCAAVLRAAVGKAAGEIARRHAKNVAALRDEVEHALEKQKAYERDRAAALAEFHRKRRGEGP